MTTKERKRVTRYYIASELQQLRLKHLTITAGINNSLTIIKRIRLN